MRLSLAVIFWIITVFLALCLVVISAGYFNFATDHHFLQAKQDLIHNQLWLGNFYVHLAGGIIAVLSGLVLFFKRLVPFKSLLHKRLGRIYVFAILFISGPTGFYLAFFAEGGPFASLGFLLMSSAWMFITWKAVDKILKGDVEGHNKWMIRSYCFTLSGVTLRLSTPLFISWFQFDYETSFIVSAYLPWLFNILVGELILLYNRKTKPVPVLT